MLKGKLVLTKNYLGTVLNDAANEPAMIIRAIRRRNVKHNSQDIISRMIGVAPVDTWWEACACTVVVPWKEVGESQVVERLPKWLYARRLHGRRPVMLQTTRIGGRTYIDW